MKEKVNFSETIRAMQHLNLIINQYQTENKKLPAESFVEEQKPNLQGAPRMGDIVYRGKWIGPLDSRNTILAYVQKNYRGLLAKSGYVVLRLNGKVEWVDKESFKMQLELQEKPGERQ